MNHPGLIVLTQAYHPDWKVIVDGQKKEIFQTNYLFRSIFVPEGQHTIKFIFAPFSFYAGMGVSLLSLIFIVFLFVYPRCQKN